MNIVDLTDEMVDSAAEYALDLSDRNSPKTLNLCNDRDFMGCLGELAFKAYLEEHGIYSFVDYEYFDSYKKGGSDDYDFKITNTGETIDLKTTVQFYNLLIKESAYKRKPMDYYVLVVLWGNKKAKIVGYATKKQVNKLKPKMVKTLDYVIKERYLLPIDGLLEHMRRC